MRPLSAQVSRQRFASRVLNCKPARSTRAVLFAMSPDGISVVDHTGRILLCNEQFARMHGYEHSAEIIGRYAAEFMLPEVYAGMFTEVAAAFAAGESVVSGIEIEAFKRDGATVTTEYSVVEVPWLDAPAGVAFISHIRDITRRKALLAELERHQTLLEGQVQERTRDLEAEIAERAALQTTLQRTEAILAEAQRIALIGTWEVGSGNRRSAVVRRSVSHLGPRPRCASFHPWRHLECHTAPGRSRARSRPPWRARSNRIRPTAANAASYCLEAKRA